MERFSAKWNENGTPGLKNGMERKNGITSLLSKICFLKMEQKAERNGTLCSIGFIIEFASRYLHLKERSNPERQESFKAILPLSAGSKMYVCMTN